MNRKIPLVAGAAAVILLVGLLVLGPGVARDVDAQGLVEYQLFFFRPNVFEVNGASFWSIPVDPNAPTGINAWKPTKISDGCSHWETIGDLTETEAWVNTLPGSGFLGSLGLSPRASITLKFGPDAQVTICDRMLHVPQVEDFVIYDPETNTTLEYP